MFIQRKRIESMRQATDTTHTHISNNRLKRD